MNFPAFITSTGDFAELAPPGRFPNRREPLGAVDRHQRSAYYRNICRAPRRRRRSRDRSAIGEPARRIVWPVDGRACSTSRCGVSPHHERSSRSSRDDLVRLKRVTAQQSGRSCRRARSKAQRSRHHRTSSQPRRIIASGADLLRPPGGAVGVLTIVLKTAGCPRARKARRRYYPTADGAKALQRLERRHAASRGADLRARVWTGASAGRISPEPSARRS